MLGASHFPIPQNSTALPMSVTNGMPSTKHFTISATHATAKITASHFQNTLSPSLNGESGPLPYFGAIANLS